MSETILGTILIVAALGLIIILLPLHLAFRNGVFSDIRKKFLHDLTAAARNGKLDLLVGRKPELARVMHLLARRDKRHPLLIGERGVGKTAIVHGLAIQSAEAAGPTPMNSVKILELDLQSLFASMMDRRSRDHDLKELFATISSEKSPVILFIDDIHQLVEEFDHPEVHPIRELLLSAIARSEIQVIGATTPSHYEQTLKYNEALQRFFQPVMIAEPTREETYDILESVKQRYETYHGVEIKPSAIQAVMELSRHVLSGKAYPEVAIEILDETAAFVKLHDHTQRPGGIPSVTKTDVEDTVEQLNHHRLRL